MSGRKPTTEQLLADEKAKVALLEKRVKELELEKRDLTSGKSSLPVPQDEIQLLVQRNIELTGRLEDAECYIGNTRTVVELVRVKLERYTVEDKIRLPWKEWVSLLNDVWRQVVIARKVCSQKETNIKTNPIISAILGLVGFNINPNV